jgi:hypothetical protein
VLQKIWAVCGRSATVAVGYAGVIGGILYANLDQIAGAVVDPTFTAWVHSVVDSHPVIAKYSFSAFSAIVIAARLRTLIKPRN